MRRFTVLAFGLTGMLAIGVRPVAGQINGSVVPSGAHPTVSHGARASVVHSATPASQNFGRGPIAAVGPRVINSHPSGVPGYSGMTSRPNYSPYMRSLNPTLAAMHARNSARIDRVEPTASMLARNEFARRRLAFANGRSDTRDYAVQPTAAVLAKRQLSEATTTTTAKNFDVDRPVTTPQVTGDGLAPRKTPHNGARHNWREKDNRSSFSDARRCHWHEWHNRDWWCQHFSTIVLVGGGYYFWDAGYWYPAWGYDPLNNYYDYDGPIYTYGNLLPDEVITNVQVALQDAGYYLGPITGSLNEETRAALANFQRDYGLPITGAIDEPTVQTLGLYQSGVYQSGDVLDSNY
jgi:putative peptidoglycan binding protein